MALQVWLPLNGNVNNKGLSNTTVTNSGATITSGGKLGRCYSFDGNDDYISLLSSELYPIFAGGSQSFSISLWVYRADATRAVLFGDYGLSGSISLNVELTTGHEVRFYWAASPDRTFSGALTQSAWNHVVLTYDGTKVDYYLNGVKKDTYNGTLASKSKTSGSFYLGRDNRTGATAFNGKLNDFRIYDHCLSPKEVKELSKGLYLHYKLEGNSVRSGLVYYDSLTFSSSSNTYIETGLTPNDNMEFRVKFKPTSTQWALFGGSTTTSNGVRLFYTTGHFYAGFGSNRSDNSTTLAANVVYDVIFSKTSLKINGVSYNIGKGTSYPTTLSFGRDQTWDSGSHGLNGEAYHFQVYESGELIRNFIPCSYNGTAGMWDTVNERFYGNAGSGTFTLGNKMSFFSLGSDTSGYGYDGTVVGTLTASSDTPRYANSTTFTSGQNYHIVTPSIAKTDFQNSYSISWWSKTADMNNKMAWGSISGNRLNIYPTNNVFCLNTGDSANNPIRNGSTSVTFAAYNGAWHHYVLTGDGTNANFYIDGALVGKAKTYKPLTSDVVYISGWDNSSSYTWNGSISDFRMYSTVLSADDIKELHDTSAFLCNNDTMAAYELVEETTELNIDSKGVVKCASYEEVSNPNTFGDGYITSEIFYEF